VAFADGGEINPYLPGEPVLRMAEGGIPRYNGATGSLLGDIPNFALTGQMPQPQPGAPENQTWAQNKLDQLADKVLRGIATPQEKAWISMFGKDALARAQAREQQASAQPTQPAKVPAVTPTVQSPAVNTTATAKPDTDAGTSADTGASTRASTSQTVVPPIKTQLAMTPEAIKNEMGIMGLTSGVPAEITGGIEDLRKKQEELARADLAEIQAEQKARGPAMAGFEARLKAKESRLSKEEGTLGPLALLQAGLSIMSGTSPFGLANIGAGASVGLKAYTDGLDKLERSRDKIDEAFAKIEEVRRNEGRMDAKELRDAKKSIHQVEVEAKKLGLSALEKNWGFNKDAALKSFDVLSQNRRATLEQEGATQRTAMTVGAQRDIAAQRNEMMRDLYGGDIKARAEFGKIQTKVMSELSKDPTYTTATPAQQEVMRTQRLRSEIQNNPFLAAYASGIGFTKAPPPGKVYDLTTD
jgi:hypothetical protein